MTSKSRYALKIMLDLARQEPSGLVQRGDIAARQRIPADYMDQILGRLRDAGLVVSMRGRKGGFRLGRDASLISAWDIFGAVEDAVYPVQCLEHGQSCGVGYACSSRDAWGEITHAIESSLSGIKLSALADEALIPPVVSGGEYQVHECRAPKRHA